MVLPVTEVVYITLKSNVELEAEPAAHIWQETLSTIASQVGYVGQCYGRQYENPATLMLLIGSCSQQESVYKLIATDWTSLDEHSDFINSPIYKPFVEKLKGIAEDIYFYHMKSKPFPPSILTKAPCVEVATLYNAHEGLGDNVEKFKSAMDEGMPEGYYGSAFGEVVEDVVRPKEGAVKGRALVLLLGWESKEAHIKFRDTELFKKNIGLLREKNGGAEMVSFALWMLGVMLTLGSFMFHLKVYEARDEDY